jgi:hypothetical protein
VSIASDLPVSEDNAGVDNNRAVNSSLYMFLSP